jgi:hypothetical protein
MLSNQTGVSQKRRAIARSSALPSQISRHVSIGMEFNSRAIVPRSCLLPNKPVELLVDHLAC